MSSRKRTGAAKDLGEMLPPINVPPPEEDERGEREPRPMSEADIASELSEDLKLRSIGIDPDGDPIAIMVELEKRLRAYKRGLTRR